MLSEELANKIAAGEVIERPGSVVKELLENALDAGAGRITVEVTAGGTQLIRVVDDGQGMSRDDALLAFERHATSKISKAEDLHALRTLGFRGEALPSIAAVSRLTLETRQADEIGGTKVVIDGGEIQDVTDAGRNVGTTVTVRNLFFNTPARRKFLKSAQTEFRNVTQHVTHLAMGHPGVSFRLDHNGREVLSAGRREQRVERVRDLLGEELSEGMLPVQYSAGGVTIEGLVSSPQATRSSRMHQLCFVNGRNTTNRLVNHAVFAGYGTALPRDRYPTFVLFLEVDPRAVDVNVHPTKREVRFSDERAIHDAVIGAVRDALQSDRVVGEAVFAPQDVRKAATAAEAGVAPLPSGAEQAIGRYVARQGTDWARQTALPLMRRFRSPAPSPTARQPEASDDLELARDAEEGRTVLWQLHDRYILAPIKNGLLIIDQHVAHERIIYEDTLDHFGDRRASSQQLLFPLTLEFSFPEMQVLGEIIPLLEQMGFSIREFGRSQVIVEAVPTDLKTWGDGAVLRGMVDDMVKMGTITSGLGEKLACSFACHSAIKAGRKLSPGEMENLVDELFATRQPFLCPHGRPVVARMPLEGIDKLFGR